MGKKKLKLECNIVVPPCETIKELMEEKGLSQMDIAVRSGLTNAAISKLVNNQATITNEIAVSLERVLGLPASFWTKREADYRQTLIKDAKTSELKQDLSWLDLVPVRELQSRGSIAKTTDKVLLALDVLDFFGVSDSRTFKNAWLDCAVQFRGAEQALKKPGYVATWLRLGEKECETRTAKPYDKESFLDALQEIRGLTREEPSLAIPEAISLCASAGVVVCIVKQIAGASISGATRWVSTSRAMIQLSYKYKQDDHFWFTFFHEAGHVLRHGRKLIFLEDSIFRSDKEEEREANDFAANMLIPKQYASQLPYLRSKAKIKQFALAIGISPGIVVGRLQHDGLLDPSFCNNLKKKVDLEM
ncbi:MAG: helix-turn-helix domain-containing protein [Planctomycetales bacterium]|nr:helix-turn-helix domain-containing protein [Planctomycetales bacterium]